jgi:integrase
MTEARPKAFAFTEARVRAIKPPPDREYYSDTKTRSLKLAAYRTGLKTFLIYRRVQGRPERVFIGRWPDLTVEQARKIAERMNGEIAQGLNPAEERRRQRFEGTFGSLFERYLELHGRPHKRPSSVRDDEGYYRRHLARWATRRLSTITRHDVERLHAEIGEHHGRYSANRVVALVSSVFAKAIDWGFQGPNPTTGVKKFAEESRERFLTQAEMPRFLAALAQDPDADFRDFILIGLLTGARTGNVLAMAWREVDLAEAVWRIGRTKSGKAQSVPLVPPALAILARRHASANGDWVFAGRGNEHVTTFRTSWRRLLQRAEIVNLRPHDVRRTLGSWMTKSGAALPIVKAALGHANVTTTQIYARAETSDLRRALETAATRMLTAGGADAAAQTQ